MFQNLKYKLLIGLAIGLALIGIILTFFFDEYHGKLIPLHWITQLLIGPFFCLLAYFAFKMAVNTLEPDLPEDDMTYLKAHGIKIDILLKDCTIAEGSEALSLYKKYGHTAYYDEEVFDKKWGHENDIAEPVCIVYNHIGKIYTTSLLYISKQELLSKLDNIKKTTIYLHAREDYYYFDLEFLLN